MPRYFAFLRAINVGGRVVKMDRLRKIFESLGFSNVETFIASGNVIFDSPSKNAAALEAKIEKELQRVLGYEVSTFIRTGDELIDIANYEAFPQSDLAKARSFNVVFLGKTLDKEAEAGLLALRTEIDDLHLHGREIYWLCRKKQSESMISNVVFSKAVGLPATVRGVRTVKNMTGKYARSKR
jgi:uncharacterized protein (DUF1697 family)